MKGLDFVLTECQGGFPCLSFRVAPVVQSLLTAVAELYIGFMVLILYSLAHVHELCLMPEISLMWLQ